VMHLSRFSEPSRATKRYVQLYVQREAQLGLSMFMHPVTARSAHLLDFEFGDPIEIQLSGTDFTRTAETAAVVGLRTAQRSQLLMRGNVESFVIFLQPAAIHQLFRLPASDVVNCDYASQAVLGAAVSELYQRLGNARSFQERVQIADQFIASQSFRASAFDPIELAANEIMRNHGKCRIDSLAHHASLSIRSLQRMFWQRIGVSPKLYARIIRFESALKTKASSPHQSWTAIAQQFGYHDQMHMIHDFEQLSGETPTGILGRMEKIFGPQIHSPERQDPDLLVF
jgi:AraC-like DNA-binding protein